MSFSINTLTFTGRVGAVFGIRKFGTSALLEFTAAVRSNFRNRNGEYDAVWYRCKVWDKLEARYITMLADRLSKGAAVCCTGQLEFDPATGGPRVYLGGDGSWKSSFTVNCREVVIQSNTSAASAGALKKSSPTAASPELPSEGYAVSDEGFGSTDDVPW